MQRNGYGPLFQEVVNIAIIFVVKFLHVSIYRLKETKTDMEYELNFLDGHQLNNLIVRLLSKGPFHGWKSAQSRKPAQFDLRLPATASNQHGLSDNT